LAVTSWLPGQRPPKNLELSISHKEGNKWLAWFRSKDKIRQGDALFASYGVGSTHHVRIREDVAQQTADKPKFYEKKDAKRKQLALARQARTSDLLKPKGKQQAPPLRQAPLLPPAKERRTSAVIAEALMAPNKRCVHLAARPCVWQGNGEGRRVRQKAIEREAAKLHM